MAVQVSTYHLPRSGQRMPQAGNRYIATGFYCVAVPGMLTLIKLPEHLYRSTQLVMLMPKLRMRMHGRVAH
jgi:hypothetical protein